MFSSDWEVLIQENGRVVISRLLVVVGEMNSGDLFCLDRTCNSESTSSNFFHVGSKRPNF